MRDPYRLIKRDEKAIKAAAELAEEIGKKNSQHLQRFGFVFQKDDGTIRVKDFGDQFCWAVLECDCHIREGEKLVFIVDWSTSLLKLGEERKGPAYVAQGIRDFTCSRYDAERFTDYLLNKSIWRRAFATRDPVTVYSKPVIYNTMHPLRFVLQAAMAVRMIYEKPYVLHTWELFSKYVNPDVALYLAHHYKWDREKKAIVKNCVQGHSLFNGTGIVDRQQILVSLNNRDFSFMRGQAPAEKKCNSYRNLESIWTRQTRSTVHLIEPDTDWESQPYDPTNPWVNYSRVKGWKQEGVENFLKSVVERNTPKKAEANA